MSDIESTQSTQIHTKIESKTKLLIDHPKIYTQYDLEFEDFKVILTTGINLQNVPVKPRSAVIILSGLNTYYFHHHLKEYLPDHDFFIIDPPARGFNINYSYKNKSIPDSYIDNMDLTYTYIKSTLEY